MVSTTEPEYVAKYYKLLGASLADLTCLPTDDHQLSVDTLRTISTASYGCVPYMPDTRLCKRKYWYGQIPIAAALDAHMEAIKSITFHLPGLGQGIWWRTRQDRIGGIREVGDQGSLPQVTG